MEALEIQLDKRDTRGKGATRKLRKAGKIPGIMYGHGEEPIAFEVDSHGFVLSLEKSPYGRNQVFAVRGIERDVEALIKDLQFHPVSREILHCDLIEVRKDDKVRVEIPVRHKGKAAGQSAGGTLRLLRRSVKIECSPNAIPFEIMLDVTPLGVGEDITVGALPLPEGVVALGDQKVVVLTIKAPRVSGKQREDEGDAKKKK